MVRVFVFLAALQLILVVLALISCLSADRVRALPRAVWVLTILLIPLLGPAAYFLAGRPVSAAGPAAGQAGPGRRPANPDDDPEFLRSLNAEQARRDRELFAEWERDLHRRENDLRDGADEPHRANEPDSLASEPGSRAGEPGSRADEPNNRDNEPNNRDGDRRGVDDRRGRDDNPPRGRRDDDSRRRHRDDDARRRDNEDTPPTEV